MSIEKPDAMGIPAILDSFVFSPCQATLVSFLFSRSVLKRP